MNNFFEKYLPIRVGFCSPILLEYAVMRKKCENKSKIILIIPAYNEEESILSTYKKVAEFNRTHSQKYDVIVVNDGSSDDTEKILRNNDIPHLQLKQNLGIGGAVQAGYKYAHLHNYDIAVQFDGDGQHDVECVATICKPVAAGKADMCIGSRFVDDSSSEFKSSGARRAGIRLISGLIKLFTGVRVLDTTSGFRAVNNSIIGMFAHSYVPEYPEPVTTTRVAKLGKKITEVPVSMNERTGGESSISLKSSIYYMINVFLLIITEALGGYKHSD